MNYLSQYRTYFTTDRPLDTILYTRSARHLHVVNFCGGMLVQTENNFAPDTATFLPGNEISIVIDDVSKIILKTLKLMAKIINVFFFFL